MSTDQAEGTTVSPESAQEFKWEIPEASVTLGPTFYVHADSMFVLMQMVYSTMNSWSPSVQITARVYGSNGEKKFSTISESSTGFEVSDDWLSAKCGPMTIDRVAGDELKYRVVFDTPDLKLDIVHWCEVAPFLVGTGLHPFIENEPELGFVRSSFVPRATSVGKVILDGVETAIQGRGCLTFVKQLNPHHIALWNFCSFQSESHSLMLYQVPKFNSFICRKEAKNRLFLRDRWLLTAVTKLLRLKTRLLFMKQSMMNFPAIISQQV